MEIPTAPCIGIGSAERVMLTVSTGSQWVWPCLCHGVLLGLEQPIFCGDLLLKLKLLVLHRLREGVRSRKPLLQLRQPGHVSTFTSTRRNGSQKPTASGLQIGLCH